MHFKLLVVGVFIFFLTGCQTSPSSSGNSGPTSTISITSITPAEGSVVSSSDTIQATVSYTIPESVNSDYGFEILLVFQCITTGMTTGSDYVTIIEKNGTTNISSDLSMMWDNEDIKHPLRCYLYLLKNNSDSSSSVIAKAGPIDYME